MRESIVERVVGHRFGARAVDIRKPGDADLDADGLIALLLALADRFDGLGDIAALGVGIAQHLLATRAAEKLIERHVGGLGLDVPKRGIDAGDRRHGDRAAAPIGALVEILPDVLDAARVAADQERDEMVLR